MIAERRAAAATSCGAAVFPLEQVIVSDVIRAAAGP